jgi:hypothetical protein
MVTAEGQNEWYCLVQRVVQSDVIVIFNRFPVWTFIITMSVDDAQDFQEPQDMYLHTCPFCTRFNLGMSQRKVVVSHTCQVSMYSSSLLILGLGDLFIRDSKIICSLFVAFRTSNTPLPFPFQSFRDSGAHTIVPLLHRFGTRDGGMRREGRGEKQRDFILPSSGREHKFAVCRLLRNEKNISWPSLSI